MTQTSKGIEEFKEEIRSILIANKGGLPLNKISREYYDLLGKPTPYRALGFSNEVELFKAVPDAVRIVDRGELYLYAVCNEKTEHIVRLVSKQKNNLKSASSLSKSGHYLPPGMQHSGTYKQTNQCNQNFPKVPPWLRTNILDLVSRYADGLSVENVKCAYRTAFGTDLNFQDYNYMNMADFLRSLENENILTLCEKSNTSIIYPIKCTKQQVNQNTVVKSEQVLNRIKENEEATFVPECEVSNEKNHEYVPKIVLENLRKTTDHFPEGFLITQLDEAYKEVTRSSLNLEEMGYNNIQEFVSDLEDIFRVQVNCAGDWILTDARLSPEPEEQTDSSTNRELCARRDIPDHIQRNIFHLLKHSDGIDLQELEQFYKVNFNSCVEWKKFGYESLESMLMSLEFSPPIRFARCGLNKTLVMLSPEEPILRQVNQATNLSELEKNIPDDAVLLGQIYTAVKVPTHDDYFAVLASSVDSPGKLWLQEVSQTEQRNVELDKLMDDLEDFYQSPEAEKYRIPEKYLMKTLNCAVVYKEDINWHRGCIIGKPGPTSYQVFYYDYGTIDVVEKSFLRFLKKSFAILPAQAFSARLAMMKPLSTFYSHESCSRMFELCSGKPLMAQIISRTYMNTNSVILCDTSDGEMFINDVLIKEGLVGPSADQIELRKPYEVTSPDSCSISSFSPNSFPTEMPTFMTCPDPQICSSPPGFYNPAESLVTQLNPTLFTNNLSVNDFQLLPYTTALSDSQTCLPPNELILKRIEERELAKRKATVEPIQVPQSRSPDADSTSLIIQENKYESIDSDAMQHLGNNMYQEADEMYDSSSEDDANQEPFASTTLSASAITKPSSTQLRFCKKLCFKDEKYSAYLINFDRQPCFTSAHLSSFIFGVDIVKRILHIQKYPPCHIVASREEHPSLFEELERIEMSGFTREDPTADKVVLYALADVLKILTFLNHNKETLVEDIEEIQRSFNPDDDYWTTSGKSLKLDTYEEKLEYKFDALKEERRLLLRVMLSEDCSNVDDARRLLKIHENIYEVKDELSELRSHSKLKSVSERAREFLERAKLDFQDEQSPEKSTRVAPTSAIASPSPQTPPTAAVDKQTNPAAIGSTNVCAAPASATLNTQKSKVSEKARKFLERAKLEFQDERSPEKSTCVASTSAIATPPPQPPPAAPVDKQANLSAIDFRNVCAAPVTATHKSKVLAVCQPAIPLQAYAPVANTYRVAQHIPVNFPPPTFYPNRYVYPQQNIRLAPPGMRFPNVPCYYNQWKQ